MTKKELQQLRANLVAATRDDFDRCREHVPDATIYAYALVMCSINGEALQPWCHTEEAYAKKEAKASSASAKEAAFRRYCPDEWWATAAGPSPNPAIQARWNTIYQAFAAAYTAFHADNPLITFELLCETLAKLDEDGYFGTGKVRARVTLMVYVSDSALSETWWPNSVQRLNPRSVVKRFRAATNM